jgi:hypothetical protein
VDEFLRNKLLDNGISEHINKAEDTKYESLLQGFSAGGSDITGTCDFLF